MPKFQYGSVAIQARNVTVEDLPRQAPPQREGFAGRTDRLDVRSFAIESLHAGLGVHVGTGAENDANRYKESQGLWAHQLNKLVMPPALTAQSNLQAVNASGYRDLNIGVVTARSSLGGSTPLNYYGVGPYLIRENTSGVLSIAHTFTNNVVWIDEVTANSTRYFAVVTDGTTDDAVVTTDPTAGSISFSTWFALASGDRIDWFRSMREAGNGHTVMAGKLGSRTGFFHLAHSAALATAPSPGVNTTTRETEGDLDMASVTAIPTILVQNGITGAAGNHRWEGDDSGSDAVPAEVAAAGDSEWAEASTNPTVADDLSTELIALGYDFGDITQYSSAIIKGIEYAPTIDRDGSIVVDWQVFVYTLSQQSFAPNLGLTEETAGSTWPSTFTQRTYGSNMHLHGRPWSPEDLNILQVSHSIEFTTNSGGGTSANIDSMPVTVYYKMPGTQQVISQGSELIGPDPVVAGRLWVIEPEGSDPTGRVVPRRLVRVDVDYDPGGLRPSFTVAPQSNLPCFPYVLAGAIGEQALFLALGNNKDLAKHFIRIPFNNLVPEDVEWSRDQGFTEDWGINALYAIGNDCILQCATVAGTVMQDMLYESHTDSVHFYGPRHTTTSLPLRMKGQGRTSAASRRRHAFLSWDGLIGDIVAWWRGEDGAGANMADTVGGNTLTQSGTLGSATGKIGNGRDFESGSSQYASAADAAGNSITGNLSISAWVNPETVGAGHVILAKWLTTGNQRSYDLYLDSTGFHFAVSGNGTATTTVDSATVPAPSTWYHVVAVHENGVGIRIYVNGALENSAAHTTGIFDGTSPLIAGALTTTPSVLFDGIIDEIILLNVAATAAEVTTLYGAGSGGVAFGLQSVAQYTPDTPHLDPFATLSAVVKQDGPLHITMGELPIMGPPEGRNALLTARCGSRQVSATKTIALYYSLDGGANFTLWTTFTAYGAVATLSPAVSASTVVLRLELDNPTASADTPGGLPLYVFGDSDFDPRRRYTVELDEEWLNRERGGAGGPEELWDTLSAIDPHLQDVTLDNAVQGKFKWNRFRSGLIPGDTTSRPVGTFANPENMSHVLVFDEVAV